jgi:two-component system nitrogen regulation response regulator NtrX
MNLVFALERLERHNLQLVAASTRPLAGLVDAGWDPVLVNRLGEVWVALPQISGHADDVPEIASLLLAHLAERGEVPLRHFSSGAQNALRLAPLARGVGRTADHRQESRALGTRRRNQCR